MEPFVLRVGQRTVDALPVLSWTATEACSELFQFDINVAVATDDVSALQDEILGEQAWFWLRSEHYDRVVHGIVGSIATGRDSTLERQVVRLRLVPEAWRMQKRVNSRVFQEQTLLQIVHQLLAEHGIEHRFAVKKQQWQQRTYCVQYQESDYAFLSRLLAEEGVSFCFVQPDSTPEDVDPGRSTLLMLDDNDLAPVVVGPSALRYHPLSSGMPPAEDHLFEFTSCRTVQSSKLTFTDYDFERPLTRIESTAEAPDKFRSAVELEVYDHRGEYQEIDVEESFTAVKLEQEQRRRVVAEGNSACRRLAPGHRVEVAEHTSAVLNGEYLVTKTRHEALAVGSQQAEGPRYRVAFECVPTSVALRPARVPPTICQVVETATVIGPADEEIHTDEYGRVRVRFHWDRALEGDQTSCWLRVAQAWSGVGWGFQFIPRIGMEVLVSFLGGDVDRPVIIGCMPNTTHPLPHRLPDNSATSGIRTRSTPGGEGYNELSFNDSRGAEEVTLRAEKDLVEDIVNDRQTGVGGSRRVTVSGDDTLLVLGSRAVSSAGSSREELMGDASRTVYGNIDEQVYGGESRHVTEGSHSTFGDSAIVDVDGEAALTVRGNSVVTLGSSETSEASIQAEGHANIGAGMTLRLVADERVELAVGQSTIVIDKDSIKLCADTIELKGRKGVAASGPGPVLTLEDAAQLVAKTVRIFAKDSRIELEEDAKLQGKRVLVNCDENEMDAASEEEEQETKPFSVQLTDYDEEPYAEKHFKLSSGGKVFEGETTGDGRIDVELPENAAVAQIELWIDEFPEGKTKSYTINLLAALPPPSTSIGAKQRLKNLGYYEGTVEDTIDGLAPALKWFQKDWELTQSGALDQRTQAALKEAAGG